MPAGVVPQFCAGSVYAWSVFNKPIELQIFGEVNNTAPITFTIAIGCLGLSAAVMGPWLERNGPRKACLLGTSLFFAGNITTALALYLKQLWLVFLGYGVVGSNFKTLIMIYYTS
jgi:MFS family permease